MADLGLLGAIGEGLKAGTEGFRSGYDMRAQSEARKQAQLDAVKARKLQALMSGYQENEAGDDYMKTPEQLAKEEKAAAKEMLGTELEARKAGLLTVKNDKGLISGFEQDPAALKLQLARMKQESDKERQANTPIKAIQLQLAEGKLKELQEGKKPTAGEFQAAGYAKRLEQSQKEFEDLQKEGYDPTSVYAKVERSILPNLATRGTTQQQEQAERNFVNAVLRRESGAAISPTEFGSAEKQYFPRQGDSPEVIKQKAINRAIVAENLKNEAGKAYSKLPSLEDFASKVAFQGETPNPAPSGLIELKNANAAKQLSQQDQAAIQWAKSNPKDPRAIEILKGLGQ